MITRIIVRSQSPNNAHRFVCHRANLKKLRINHEFTRSTSQVRARVIFESRVKFKSGYFTLISFDCDSFFHNVAPTDVQNINSPRYIFPVERSREFIPSVGNYLLNEIYPIPCLLDIY